MTTEERIRLVLELAQQGDIKGAISNLRELKSETQAAGTAAQQAKPDIYAFADTYDLVEDAIQKVATATVEMVRKARTPLQELAAHIKRVEEASESASGAAGGKGVRQLGQEISYFSQDAVQGMTAAGDATDKLRMTITGTANNAAPLLLRALGPVHGTIATLAFMLIPALVDGLGKAFNQEPVKRYRDRMEELKETIEELEKKEIKTEFDFTEIDRYKAELAEIERRKAALAEVEKTPAEHQADAAKRVSERVKLEGGDAFLNRLMEAMPAMSRVKAAEDVAGGATNETRAWRQKIAEEAATIIEAAQGKIGTPLGQQRAREFLGETGVFDPFKQSPQEREAVAKRQADEESKQEDEKKKRVAAGIKEEQKAWDDFFDEWQKDLDEQKKRVKDDRDSAEDNREDRRKASENASAGMAKDVIAQDPVLGPQIQELLRRQGNTPDAMNSVSQQLQRYLRQRGIGGDNLGRADIANRIVNEQSQSLQQLYDTVASSHGQMSPQQERFTPKLAQEMMKHQQTMLNNQIVQAELANQIRELSARTATLEGNNGQLKQQLRENRSMTRQGRLR